MRNLALEFREQVFRSLPGQPHIDGVGAQLDLIAPLNLPPRPDVDLLESAVVVPSLEDAAPCQIGQIYLALLAVGERNKYPIIWQRLNRNWPNHNFPLIGLKSSPTSQGGNFRSTTRGSRFRSP